MQIKKDNIIINYTEEEIGYINEFFENIIKESKTILEFFNLEKLEYPVIITFWDDLNKYREYRNKQLEQYNKKVQDWEVGCAQSYPQEPHYIHILSLKERIKCQGHQNDKLEDIFKVGVHEYVHICHCEYKKYKGTTTYINEGLATYLSNQFNEKQDLTFNCTKEQLLQGATNYSNYYLLMKYIIDNKSKEYILELIKSKEMQEQELDTLYEEFVNILIMANSPHLKVNKVK